ncbi:MAG: histidinol phosphate phosphatase [Arcobacter sp.]|nr:MAG: histidinol phosphate phosphatase [Arcobacter sp.]
MRIDLHNHTVLCNHATGTTDEYIKKAIELNIDVFGFSEHAPMNFDEKYRLKLEDKNFYENDVLTLKQKYKNDIEIVLGYEVDYLQGDYVLPEVINSKVDYLIGSVHFINNGWGFDNPEFIGTYKNKDIDTIWEDYFEEITQMVKSNLFDIVGHLDLIKVFKFLPKKDIKIIAQKALQQIKKHNMVVEINSSGFRKPIGEQYPSKELLELCYELNIPITFSSDAHSVDQVGLNYEKARAIAQEVGYTKATYFNNREKIEVLF